VGLRMGENERVRDRGRPITMTGGPPRLGPGLGPQCTGGGGGGMKWPGRGRGGPGQPEAGGGGGPGGPGGPVRGRGGPIQPGRFAG